MSDKTDNLYFVQTANAFLTAEGLPRTELFVEDQLHLNCIAMPQVVSIKLEIENHQLTFFCSCLEPPSRESH